MLDNIKIPDEALTKAVDVIDNHVGETYDLTINQIAKEAGSGFADLVHLIFGLPHFLNSPFFKEKAKQFINELVKKKRKIPDERLKEPDFHTVSMALDNCRHCITNDDLRLLYVNLIVNTMDAKKSNLIHPSFADIIKQMNTLDALVLNTFSEIPTQPLIEVGKVIGKNQFQVIHSNLYFPDFCDDVSMINELSSSITNLDRLGLIKIDFIVCVAENVHYEKLIKLSEETTDFMLLSKDEVKIRKGLVELTPFGHDFLSVCLDDNTTSNNTEST